MTSARVTACELGSPADVFRLIWIEVLGKDAVSADDNFVEAGGNSLSAMILIVEVHARLGVRLAMREIFTSTFGDLSHQLTRTDMQS